MRMPEGACVRSFEEIGPGSLVVGEFAPEDRFFAIRADRPTQAGTTDLAETADIASNVLSGFSLKADQMNRVGDVLVATSTESNTGVRLLGETLKYVAPVAGAVVYRLVWFPRFTVLVDPPAEDIGDRQFSWQLVMREV